MTPEALELLAKILHGSASLPDAVCRDWPLVFDAATYRTDEPDMDEYVIGTALRLCHSCPALDRCRGWLDSLAADAQPPGVVAGRVTTRGRMTTPKQHPPRSQEES